MDSSFSFLYFAFLPLSLLLLLRYAYRLSSPDKFPTPPGPRPWPFVGNIFHVGPNPHVSMAKLAQTHGPLISVKLGSQMLIVGSSPKVAAEIMKTHDSVLSGRYVPEVISYKRSSLHGFSLVWAEQCTETWRSLRTICRTQLFSAKAMESKAKRIERAAADMVEYLKTMDGKAVHIGDVVFTTVFNSLTNLFFSKDLLSFDDDDGVSANLKKMMSDEMKIGAIPNIADFYPMFSGLDIQGLRRKSHEFVSKMFDVLDVHIKERTSNSGYGDGHGRSGVEKEEDLLDVFLANNFHMDQIRIMFMELLTAATDTTTSTVEWALSELIKNGEPMAKLRKELTESPISQLPYLHACIKETLRLHPPTPFLLPRRALESCEIMNYRIPKNSRISINVWAIGRDPTIWEDALTFQPERFLDSEIDFKGQSFELLPFGSGRRICPGIPMAAKQIPVIVASLVASFDWYLPDGNVPTQIDMNEKFGLTLHKEKPLVVVPKLLL